MKKYKTKKIVKKIIYSLLALLVVGIILFPIIWMLPAAFKGKQEIWAIPNTFFPKEFTFKNFERIFDLDHNGYNFIRSLGMTMLVATLSVVGSLTVNMLAAYAFARLEFRGKKFLWVYFIATMFIPGITILLTSVKVVSFLNMTDTVWVLVIPGLVSGYNIFFFRQFYLGLPASLEEAAAIEGCSPFRIFLKIFLPMSVTPMVIIGVSVFMGYWNSFMWPTLTIVNNPDLAQVMQVIRVLKTSYSGEFGIVIAATLLAILPPLIIFAIFQKKIVAGIAISGLK